MGETIVKRILISILAIVVVISSIGCPSILLTAAGNGTAMQAGDIDVITIKNANNTCYGNTTAQDQYGIKLDGYEGSFAVTTNGVSASQVKSGWRWFLSSSSFYNEVAAVGDWIYALNSWDKETIPEITYGVTAGTKIEFSLGLRVDTAYWDEYKLEFSTSGSTYESIPSAAITYTTASYDADDTYKTGSKQGQRQVIQVRKYSVNISENGFLKVTMPKGSLVNQRTVNSSLQLNTDGEAYFASSTFMTPAACVSLGDSNRLYPGDSDKIQVNEAVTTAVLVDNQYANAVSKKAVFSRAEINSAIAATKVLAGEKWLEEQNDFYTEIAQINEWLYTPNPDNIGDIPTVTYYVAGNSKVAFQIIGRDGICSFEDVKISFAPTNGQYSGVENYQYSDLEYFNDSAKFNIRTYCITLENDGKLQIELPTASKINEAILNSSQVHDIGDLKYSSLMMSAAVCVGISTAINKGESEELNVDINGLPIEGSKTDENTFVLGPDSYSSNFAYLEGIAVSKVFSTWKWFKKNSLFYEEVVPYSAGDINQWVYVPNGNYSGDTPQIIYGVTANTSVKFKIGLRTDAAMWSEIKILYSSDELHYKEFAQDNISFESEIYTAADCSYYGGINAGKSHSVNVREYTVNIPQNGKLKIVFPTSATIKGNICDNFLNTSGGSLIYSSVFMLPIKCTEYQGIASAVNQKDNQDIVVLTSKRIMVYSPISCKELGDYILLKNATYKVFGENNIEITDNTLPLASKYTVKFYDNTGNVFKELTVLNVKNMPYYAEKEVMQKGDYDSATWDNCPQGFNEETGEYFSVSQYLTNTTLKFADVTGAMLLKNTSDWYFSPAFTVEKWGNKYAQVYCMGNQASGKEPPTITWRVAAKSEIQIPIQMPNTCNRFFDDFKFKYSTDGTTWVDMPVTMMEYTQTPVEYTYYTATQRMYSIHFAEEGYVKVIWPERDLLAAELEKINNGADFIEAMAYIIPPRVTVSSRDSSVIVKGENPYLSVDEESLTISFTCLKSDNVTFSDFIELLEFKNCQIKAINFSGTALLGKDFISNGLKLECRARNNAFYDDNALVKTYTLKLNLIDKYIVPIVKSKDASVVIDEESSTITVLREALDTIKVIQFLEMLEFENCTYKLTLYSGAEYSNLTTDLGQDDIMLVLYAKDCPSMKDGTVYKKYDIISELFEKQMIFRSRDHKKVYIDETSRIIYFKNDITISEFMSSVILENTDFQFYSMPDASFETTLITDTSTVLKKGMSMSLTTGTTLVYYEFEPMSKVISEGYTTINTIRIKKAVVVPGYDADTGYIIGLAISGGLGILLIIGGIIFTVVVIKKKRRGDKT